MYEKLYSGALLDLSKTIAKNLFLQYQFPWQVLPYITDFIIELGNNLPLDQYNKIADDIWIAKTAKIEKSAYLKGPLIVCDNAEIRHCAFIRGSAIIGENTVVGNSTEIKNSILFDKVQVPHYNYVGDSILGYKAHMGAGSITSNVKSDKSLVVVKTESLKIETQLKKFGAVLGDCCEIGCNSVLNPGSVIGKNSNIYPLSMVRGFVPQNSIYKSKSEIIKKCL